MALKNFADLLRVQQQFAARIATPAEAGRGVAPKAAPRKAATKKAAPR